MEKHIIETYEALIECIEAESDCIITFEPLILSQIKKELKWLKEKFELIESNTKKVSDR